MTRKKVRLAFIENINRRKASYKKRHKGFLKKAQELNTLCNVEMAAVIYSPYHDEPEVFPNNDIAINTFTNFRQFPEHEQSKKMVTQENFTKQRMEKIEEQLQKVKKENRVSESTNKMYEMLNGKDIHVGMHLYDLNDLSYVINKNLKQVCEAIKVKAGGEGSTSYASQPIVGLMKPGGTSSEEPRASLLAPIGAPVLVAPLMVPCETNFEGTRDPLSVPNMAPISMIPPAVSSMFPSASPAQVPQSMFHLATPLRNIPQTIPLVDPSRVPPSHPFSSQILPPIVPQIFSTMPQQMDLRSTPKMAPPIPPTIMSSPMSSPMRAPPMSVPVFSQIPPQINPSKNFPLVGASVPIDNYQNYSVDFPQSPALSEMMDWNDDIMKLLDDPSFNNINVQDPSFNNFEGTRDPPLVPNMAPISMIPPAASSMFPSAAPAQVSQPMFHIATPVRNLPQTVPLVDPSRVPPSHSFSSQILPPIVPRIFSTMPQQMDLRRDPGMAPPIPPTIMTSPMPSPIRDPPTSIPVFSQIPPQINPSMNFPLIGASVPMNNYQNYSVGFPQSPALSEMLDWNNDIMTLFNDSSFNDINVQDPNHNNNC